MGYSRLKTKKETSRLLNEEIEDQGEWWFEDSEMEEDLDHFHDTMDRRHREDRIQMRKHQEYVEDDDLSCYDDSDRDLLPYLFWD